VISINKIKQLINKIKFKNGSQLLPSILTQMIFVILAGAILLMLVSLLFSDNSNIESAISACRTSVDAREYTASKSIGTARSAVPMLCKTIDIEIPEKKYAELAKKNFTKAVMMNIADRSMDCWYMFGDGMYDKNVFSGWNFFQKNQCFACFTFTINEEKNYEPISLDQFYNFVNSEPYKPVPKHVPICLFDDEKKENCVSRDSPECIRKGGICINKKDQLHGYVLYEGWSCDSRKEVCYIPPSMLETYNEYMFNKAYGVFSLGSELVGNDLDVMSTISNLQTNDIFTKDKIYSVAFISHTRDIGLIVTTGVVAAAIVTAVVLSGGTAAAVAAGAGAATTTSSTMAGITFVYGTGSITGTLATSTVATGASLSKLGALTILGSGVGGGTVGAGVTEFLKKDAPTIYISDLNGIEDKCNVVGDFNQ
jgi:hypothetical protein